MVDRQVNVMDQTVNSTVDENAALSPTSRDRLLNSGKSRKLPQYLAAISVTIGAFAMGTVMAWSSPASGQLQSEFHFTLSQVSWIGSLVALGGAAAVLPVGYLTDKLGRKITMLSLVLPLIGGWALIVWANSLMMFCIGRFITGMAAGAFTVTAPIYIGEIAEKEIRGILGSFFQLMVTIGVLFVYILGREFKLFWMSVICGIVPLIFGIVFAFMPETPVYHLRRGKEDEARKSIIWLRGTYCDVDGELLQMKEALERESTANPSGHRNAAKMALFITIGLMTFQQLSGINAIIFYTTDIFHSAGSTVEPSICTIVVGTIQVISTFVSSLIIDRVGCRVLLLISGFVMSICTYLLGLFFHLQKRYGTDYVVDFDWLPLLSLSVYIILFSIGFGPVPWMMMGALFPPQIKGLASSITCFLNWVLAFAITKFYSDLLHLVGSASTFWFFSLVTAVGIAFVYFFVPETKGKSLEEVQLELAGEDSS